MIKPPGSSIYIPQLASTSGIIFHKLCEKFVTFILHCQEKDFWAPISVTNFHFLTDSLKLPTPLIAKIS